jgi:hypothetical protein
MLMGDAYHSYFVYGIHTLIFFGKYLYVFIFPVPRHLIYEHPILIITILPVFILGIQYLGFNKPLKKSLATFALFLLAFAISLAPTINSLSAWYRYYPNIVFIFILIYISKNGNKFWSYLGLSILGILYCTVSVYWAIAYHRAANFEKAVFENIINTKSYNMTILNLPIMSNTEIALLIHPEFIEAGLKYFYNTEKRISLVAQRVTGELPARWEMKELSQNKLELKINDKKYNYFIPDEPEKTQNDSLCKVQYYGSNKWGKSIFAKIDCKETDAKRFLFIDKP